MDRRVTFIIAAGAVAFAWPVDGETRPVLEGLRASTTSIDIIFLPPISDTLVSTTRSSDPSSTEIVRSEDAWSTPGGSTGPGEDPPFTLTFVPIPHPTTQHDEVSLEPLPQSSTTEYQVTTTLTSTRTIFVPPTQVQNTGLSGESSGYSDPIPTYNTGETATAVDTTSDPEWAHETSSKPETSASASQSVSSDDTQTHETGGPIESPSETHEESRGCHVTLQPSIGIVIVVGAGAALTIM